MTSGLAILVAAVLGADEAWSPPRLPAGEDVVTDSAPEFLKPSGRLREGVSIARTPPTVDFLYYPGQTYPGKPWSNWGDSLAVGGKYYASIGDHLAPEGNAFVFEYNPATKRLKKLVDLRQVLGLPAGHYTPGKIHSRIDMGDDGWLYFATHRGSTKVTSDQYHYRGDWILRCQPATGKTEVVAVGPVPKHCIPASVLDPARLVFYGGTAPGSAVESEGIRFFAFDVRKQWLVYSAADGPARALALARSTGRVYYVRGNDEDGQLMRYDPATGDVRRIADSTYVGLRAATQETPQGIIYTVSLGQGGREAMLYALDTKTEKVRALGPAAVATQNYVASLDADPTGRYLYYIPGAHGASDADGSPIVQFDVRTGTKKVLAFLHPFYQQHYGAILRGTYSSAVDPQGETLYITWNVSRGGRAWDCCALTAVHIPASERQ